MRLEVRAGGSVWMKMEWNGMECCSVSDWGRLDGMLAGKTECRRIKIETETEIPSWLSRIPIPTEKFSHNSNDNGTSLYGDILSKDHRLVLHGGEMDETNAVQQCNE